MDDISGIPDFLRTHHELPELADSQEFQETEEREMPFEGVTETELDEVLNSGQPDVELANPDLYTATLERDSFPDVPRIDELDMQVLPVNLQNRLNAYYKSFREEMVVSDTPAFARDHTKSATVAKEALAQVAPDAVAAIYDIIKFESNNNIRLKAAQYVLDKVCGSIGSADPNDPMQKLLDKLLTNPVSREEAHANVDEYKRQHPKG